MSDKRAGMVNVDVIPIGVLKHRTDALKASLFYIDGLFSTIPEKELQGRRMAMERLRMELGDGFQELDLLDYEESL